MPIVDKLIRWQAVQKLNPNVQIMLLPEGNQFILPLPSLAPGINPSPLSAP